MLPPNTIKIIAVVLISLLFLTSAIDKILNFTKAVTNQINVFNNSIISGLVSPSMAQTSIIISILLLIIGPILMLIGVTTENKILLKIGAGLLTFFLVLATLFYHPITNLKEHPQMFKNIAIIGSLLLLIAQC
jgi:uncharacterized membrane protein YphA (DoxX/SURF4 family)